MTKNMALDIIRVPVIDRQNDCMYQSVQRHFPGCPDGCVDYGFNSETMDSKFKFGKYDNAFNRFRVEFGVRA